MKNYSLPRSNSRQGSTLSEVLVSVMVLGVGLISVASLFPVAVMRGVRANQVTQATILRYAAESQIDSLFVDPDWKYWMFTVEPTAAGTFQPVDNPTNMVYARSIDEHFPGGPGDDDGNGFINLEKLNRREYGNDGWLPGRDGIFGVPGVNNIPGFSNTTRVADDIPILAQQEVRYAGRDSKYVVVDPLGWWQMTGSRDVFGGDSDIRGGTPGTTASNVPRLNGGHRGNNTYVSSNPRVRPTFVRYDSLGGAFDMFPASTAAPSGDTTYRLGGYGFDEATAERIATIEDQYSTILDVNMTDIADPSAIGRRDNIDLPTTLATSILTDVIGTIEGGGVVKATFFGIMDDDPTDAFPPKRTILSRNLLHEYDINGNGSFDAEENIDSDVTQDLMSNTSRNMKWRSDEALPPFFQIERVVLQTLQEDFTWMLTARLPNPGPGPIEMDLSVFFNRRFEAIDEYPFTCTRVGGNPQVYVINYNSAGLPKPNAKRGGFMFDLEHGEWYRIVTIQEDQPNENTWVRVTLDRDVRDNPDSNTDDVDEIRAAFMRGVIDVFPLEVK